ncbi:uncharacterized protein LOC123875805 [Maniola jurtina]|uniref:uncharacterized protein LOC123875805 n=1 Tax=Maniola jurtina TaxID=191418 RepID=UPI001E686F8C|nr:uncharacterized protein LOC123875805 [Maniola jurtina]
MNAERSCRVVTNPCGKLSADTFIKPSNLASDHRDGVFHNFAKASDSVNTERDCRDADNSSQKPCDPICIDHDYRDFPRNFVIPSDSINAERNCRDVANPRGNNSDSISPDRDYRDDFPRNFVKPSDSINDVLHSYVKPAYFISANRDCRVDLSRNFVKPSDSINVERDCLVGASPGGEPGDFISTQRDCRNFLPSICLTDDNINDKSDCKTTNKLVIVNKPKTSQFIVDNRLNWASRLYIEESLKCLNTECCGNTNFNSDSNLNVNVLNDGVLSGGNNVIDDLNPNMRNSNLISDSNPNIELSDNLTSDDKCWCNKDDCRMYLDNNCSDYYMQNSDVAYENIRFKCTETSLALTTVKNECGNKLNVKNECNMNKCNLGKYYINNATECSDSETSTTLESSDESMTSLESGINTVIYESASCKEINSLPEDTEDVNKNRCTKPHSKSACVLS